MIKAADTSWYKEVTRPDWDQFFINMCFYIAERSEDYDTQIGSLVATHDHHIIGTGYNSFPAHTSYGLLSNVRPHKYKYMIHAERNAIDHMTLDSRYLPHSPTIYVSAKPCLICLYQISNKNIKNICYANTNYNFSSCESEQEDFNIFVSDRKINVYSVTPDPYWLERSLTRLRKKLV